MNSEIPFNTLGLSSEILYTIEKKGFIFASEIQTKVIPVILKETQDIVGVAQTGTGKTAAFGLPLMELLASHNTHVKCIILTPTRELAIQVAKEIDSFKGERRIKTLSVYGGQDISTQIRHLKRGVDIVVGTPGRVQDMMRRKVLDLSEIDYFVLDEADEMLKMGFIDEIETILEDTPKEKRVFLFSATMPPRIQNLSKKYMKEQIVIKVKGANVKRDNIEQIYYRVRRSDKYDVIKAIIALTDDFHGIIFCQTKVIVNELSDMLKKEQFNVDCIHGDVNQSGRERILRNFKDKKINILVATDVAARGIDVHDLTHVINHTLPREIDSYIHRIGRTGRAGKKGTAITFIDSREEYKIRQLIKQTGNNIIEGELPSREAVILKKMEKLVSELDLIIHEKDTSFYGGISEQLVQAFGDTEVIAALLYQINGSGKPEPKKRVYDHDEYRASRDSRGGNYNSNGAHRSRGGHKSSLSRRGYKGATEASSSRAKTLGRPERKLYEESSDGKNRSARREGKRADSPFYKKSEKTSLKKSNDGYKRGFGKKKSGGFKKRKD